MVSDRFDHLFICPRDFEQSRKYAETVENLKAFGKLLYYQNQHARAIAYFEKALQLAQSERDEATLTMNLGFLYTSVQKMDAAFADAREKYRYYMDSTTGADEMESVLQKGALIARVTAREVMKRCASAVGLNNVSTRI